MQNRGFHTAALLAVMVSLSVARGRAQVAVSDEFNFGSIDITDPVEHTFEFQNDHSEALEIKDVKLTPPLTVTRMASRVEPGARGQLTVRLAVPRERGDFKGVVAVNFKNESIKSLYFRVSGRLVAAIDFEPFGAFFLSTQHGEARTGSIVITNYESEPLRILEVKHNSSRFTTNLETLEPGRRFRLTLTVKPDAAPGRETEYLTLVTSSRRKPTLKVQANTVVHERVYTFPESVDFRTIPVASLKARPQFVQNLSQSLMVYQKGGTDFKISASSDVPFLRLTPQQAQLKDRFGIQIDIVPEKLKAGQFNGTISIATNDPEFPLLVVPVECSVDKDW